MTEEDEPLTPEQQARQDAEWQHFKFAAVLILGCMLSLPVAGGLYVLLIKLGYVATPW